MKQVLFDPKAFADYQEWIRIDARVALRIGELIKEILRDPFKGRGKPEPLRHNWKGYWSRRINEEHRLIYKVTDDAILIASCRFHY